MIQRCDRSYRYTLWMPLEKRYKISFSIPYDPILPPKQWYSYTWGSGWTLQRAPWEPEEVPESRYISPYVKKWEEFNKDGNSIDPPPIDIIVTDI